MSTVTFFLFQGENDLFSTWNSCILQLIIIALGNQENDSITQDIILKLFLVGLYVLKFVFIFSIHIFRRPCLLGNIYLLVY